MTSPPGDNDRVFVVEQAGRVRILKNDALVAAPFLDLRGKISSDGERGLLSIAFHPDYGTNGHFYAYLNNKKGDIRIVRYNVSSNPDVADESSADTVIAIAHPTYDNHNGGQLQFGPDRKLWASTGDGGSGGDPNGNAQNMNVLLGKLLRLDVDMASGYVPSDNPFGSVIWAFGLRNPWRFSFDRQTGDLYIADVGQAKWEEVDVATAGSGRGRGANYGWNVLEGTHCYSPATGCDPSGKTPPVLEYDHSNGACTVIGGYVSRGSRVTALQGQYIYADYCSGFVKTFHYDGAVTNQRDWPQLSPGGGVTSFGEDGRGELYIMTQPGVLYRIIQSQ